MPIDSFEAVLEAVDDEHCVAVWNNVLIQIWRRSTPAMAAARVRRIAKRLADERPGFVEIFSIVEPFAQLPDARARKELAGLARDLGPRLGATALVHEGNGFRAATVRSILVGMVILSEQRSPYQVFRTVEEGAAWLRPRPSEQTLLGKVIGDLRRRITDVSIPQPRPADRLQARR